MTTRPCWIVVYPGTHPNSFYSWDPVASAIHQKLQAAVISSCTVQLNDAFFNPRGTSKPKSGIIKPGPIPVSGVVVNDCYYLGNGNNLPLKRKLQHLHDLARQGVSSNQVIVLCKPGQHHDPVFKEFSNSLRLFLHEIPPDLIATCRTNASIGIIAQGIAATLRLARAM